MKRVLVTGAQGFVGKHLRALLVSRGVEVVGVDRPGASAEVEVDLSDPSFDAEQLAQRVGPIDGVIYMAATISRGSSVDVAARANLRTITSSAVDVFDAFATAQPSAHFVFCSTFKGYGPALHLPIDPERPPQRPDPHSYGSAKALAERLLTIAARRNGARFAIVRPTCIYGPGQHLHNAIPLFLRACLAGQNPVVFGTGKDLRDDVLASDLSYCLTEACLRRAEGPFHAAGEKGRTILEVAELCCQAVAEIGGPSGLVPIVDGSHPPKWWLNQAFDLARTRQILGYEPVPLLEGLKREARWVRDGAPADVTPSYSPPRSPSAS